MTTLYLVRHGETVENAAHILQGHMPGHLTPLGIQQAEALRDELNAIKFNTLVCSDLKRCIDTAHILNTELLCYGKGTGEVLPENIFPIYKISRSLKT